MKICNTNSVFLCHSLQACHPLLLVSLIAPSGLCWSLPSSPVPLCSWIPWSVPTSGPSLAKGPCHQQQLSLSVGLSPWGWCLVSKSTAHNPSYISHTLLCLLLAGLAQKVYGQQSDGEVSHNLCSKNCAILQSTMGNINTKYLEIKLSSKVSVHGDSI